MTTVITYCLGSEIIVNEKIYIKYNKQPMPYV